MLPLAIFESNLTDKVERKNDKTSLYLGFDGPADLLMYIRINCNTYLAQNVDILQVSLNTI